METVLAVVLAVFIVGACIIERSRTNAFRRALDSQRNDVLADLAKGGDSLRNMPTDQMNDLHMNIHAEMKRRMGAQQ